MPISCMKGTWALLPLAGLAVIVLVIVAAFPVLIVPVIVWRLIVAIKGQRGQV